MTLLLDTQVWLWMLVSPERLSAEARDAVVGGDTEQLLSAASSWEIAIKYALGKLSLPEPPHTYVPSRMRAVGATPLAVSHAHALAVASLPPHHRDPFDRILVAQTRLEGCALLSAHRIFDLYDVRVFWAC